MITGKDFQDWCFRNGQENEHKAVTGARFARHCVEQKQAEIDALKAQRDAAIQHIAEWCVAIQQNGSSWDDWGQYYKDACRDNALPEIRELLNAAIAKARGDL